MTDAEKRNERFRGMEIMEPRRGIEEYMAKRHKPGRCVDEYGYSWGPLIVMGAIAAGVLAVVVIILGWG